MQSSITMTGVVESAPQVRYTESNLAVASFSIVFNPEEMKAIKCALFGKRAEKFKDEAGAGTKLVVRGELIRSGEQNKPAISVQDYEIVNWSEEVPIPGQLNSAEVNPDELVGEDEMPF